MVIAALVLSVLSLAVSATLLFLAWHVIEQLHVTVEVEEPVDNSINKAKTVTPGPYKMVSVSEGEEYQHEQDMIAAGKWTRSD